MRQRNDVPPTARLILVITAHANRPLSYDELINASGSSRSTLERIMPSLIKQRLLVRITREGMSYFSATHQQINLVAKEVDGAR